MTADDITISRLRDLRATLEIAAEAVSRIEGDAGMGLLDPSEAAAILNETLATINAAFR